MRTPRTTPSRFAPRKPDQPARGVVGSTRSGADAAPDDVAEGAGAVGAVAALDGSAGAMGAGSPVAGAGAFAASSADGAGGSGFSVSCSCASSRSSAVGVQRHVNCDAAPKTPSVLKSVHRPHASTTVATIVAHRAGFESRRLTIAHATNAGPRTAGSA